MQQTQLMLLVISWTVVCAFVVTVVSGLLWMLDVLKLRRGVGPKLFSALMLEIVALGLALAGKTLDVQRVSNFAKAQTLATATNLPAAVTNAVPLPQMERHTIVDNRWVKPGWYLPIDKGLRLFPSDIHGRTVEFAVLLPDGKEVFVNELRVGETRSFEYGGRTYTIRLEDIDKPGWLFWIPAAYFSVEATA